MLKNFINKNEMYIKLFLKTFVISIVGIAAVSGGVWYALSRTIRAPEVPNITVVVLPDEDEEPEYDSDGELLPPRTVQIEQRRENFFTFLIFGLTEGLHANTIMVAAYDADTRQASVVSIPRDTRVDFERTRRKIVNGYLTGRSGDGGHDGGVERMRYEVSTLVGFRPDFYISIDYEAFIRVIDSIGGVEIDVPFHKRYDDPLQNLHINIPAGLQVLDGRNALHFSRYRMGNNPRNTISDYQRIANQQQVLSSVVSELLTPASVLRIPEFMGIFNDYVNSDLTHGELLWFANQIRNISGTDSLSLYTLPIGSSSGYPAWYEFADEDALLELINRTVNPLIRDITSGDLRIIN